MLGVVLLAYAMGAIPVARIISKIALTVTSNCCVRILAFARVFSDILKGYLLVTVVVSIHGPDCASFAALCGFLGHSYPLGRLLDGGNGMGVLLGALSAVEPTMGLIALGTWTFSFYIFRYASFAAFSSAIATPYLAVEAGLSSGLNLDILFAMSALIFWRQRGHLVKLAKGDEQMVVWD